MSKIRYEAAKELIAQAKYAEARVMLKTIDHPAARTLEEKLDLATSSGKLAKGKRKRKPSLWKIGAGLTIGVVISLLVLNMAGTLTILPKFVIPTVDKSGTEILRVTNVAISDYATRTQVAYSQLTRTRIALHDSQTLTALPTETLRPSQTPTPTRTASSTPTATFTPHLNVFAAETYYTRTRVALRSCPSNSCPVVKTYEADVPLHAIGIINGEAVAKGYPAWLKIESAEGDMYGYQILFSTTRPQEFTNAMIQSDLRLTPEPTP